MKKSIAYLFVAFLCTLFVSCTKDSGTLLSIEEPIGVPIEKVMTDYRSLWPHANGSSMNDAPVDHRGEKGRDHRDVNAGWFDSFDAEAPLVRLYLINKDALTGDLTVGIKFGSYLKETIEYAFEGRFISLTFFNSFINCEEDVVGDFYVEEYHIGDVITIPHDCYKDCSMVRITAGYLIPFGAAFTYDGFQSFDSIVGQ